MNCKGEAEKVYRCKECHNLRGRINTVIQNQGMVDDWDFGSEDQKVAFYQKYSGARGPALSTAVLLHVEERKTDKLVLNFKGTGQFMDLVDLRKSSRTNQSNSPTSSSMGGLSGIIIGAARSTRSSPTNRNRKDNKCKFVIRSEALILKPSSSLRRRRRPPLRPRNQQQRSLTATSL